MPLHGKIVVIRRGGGDGTEFPLTAACLFGRKIDCDIRIQLPQVSKEHCRVDINENKEVVLTNLSSVNPTCINGVPMQQSERLKHGDVFTIIDRSFRFESPPPPTPKKKRVSTSGKGEAVQVLKEHQGRDSVSSAEKNSVSDGSKTTNSMDKTVETVTMEATKPGKDTQSPFSELYQMIKQDLDPKSPWKAFGGQGKTPVSRRNSQKPGTPKKAADQEDPQKAPESTTLAGEEAATGSVAMTPKSAQKKHRSSLGQPEAKPEPTPEQVAVCLPEEQAPATETPQQSVTEAVTPGIPGTKRRSSSSIQSKPSTPTSTPGKKDAPQTPQKFSTDQVVEQLLSNPQSAETPSKAPKSPKRRSTTTAASPKPELPAPTIENPTQAESAQAAPAQLSQEVKQSPRTSPRANAGQRFKVQEVLREIELSTPPASKNDKPTSSKKRKSGGPDNELPVPFPKKKRVSFGGQLSPELFDKRLPPDSPLRRGATPSRRSLGSGLGQTPKSLLRRASTIGLVQNLKLGVAILESPKAKASPAKMAKTPSPAKKSPKSKASPAKTAKTPSPAKKSPKTKTPSPKKPASKGTPAKKSVPATPSPKRQSPAKADSQTPKGRKSPSPAKTPTGATKSPGRSPSPAAGAKTPSPSSSRKPSPSATPKTPSSGRKSQSQTPTVTGRFSISRISTPSPEAGKEEVPLRWSSMKASAKKSTRKSLGKAALEVIRRRSGASRASLKVRATWADIVKLGPTKPQTEGAVKKANSKVKVVKKAVAPKPKTPKPKTPARRLQEYTSTGHANSPATIVVGRAQIRAAQVACGAPKLVPNVVLSKIDRRMDEDLSGVSDIFKTPANTKQRRASTRQSPTPDSPLAPSSVAELSVMKTPEETGEMVVSPLSVVSSAKRSGRYNSEAVTRLLQDEQEASLVSEESSFIAKETDSTGQDEEPSDDVSVTQTPKQAAQPATATCLTGVKRLLKTPKQKAEPLEDLRGKLLKTPKQKAARVEDMAGIQRIMKTPRVKSAVDSPVVCAAAMKRLVKTPRQKAAEPAEEDLSGVQHLLKTPKQKGEPVEELFGVKRLMRTPKEKPERVEEDLTGLKELVKTPKVKGKPVQEKFGISKLMKTPRQRRAAPVEDMEGLEELLQGPEELERQTAELTETKAVELTEAPVVEVQEAMTALEETTEALPESTEELDPATEEDKENVCPLEDIQAASKPKEPLDTEAKRELQVKRLSSPLKELSLERALEGTEEPVEAEVAPLPTTEEAKEICAIAQDPLPAEVAQESEEVLVEQCAAPEPTETPAAGDAPVLEVLPLPVPLPQEEVTTPARGRRRKLVEESASTPQASPARPVRGGRGPKQLQKEEEEVVKTTPKRGRKPKQVPEEQHVNEEMVVAVASEPVGVTPPTAEEVKVQEAKVTVEMQEAVSVPECAAESIELTTASVNDEEPISPVDTMTESTEPALTEKTEAQAELPSSPAKDLAQEGPTELSEAAPVRAADVAATSQDLPEPTPQEIPAPAKGRRGRKLVEVSESAAAVASPSRAARGRVAKQVQEESIEAKPRRGRRAKQDSTEQAEDHTSEVAVAATSQPVETPATATEVESLEEATVSEVPLAQEEAVAAVAPKTTRGRRGRQTKASAVAETVAVELEVENVAPVAEEQSEPVAEAALEIEPIAESSEPAAAPVLEEPAKPVAAKPVRGRRGRQATAKVQEAEEAQESEPKAEVEDQSTVKVPAAAATAAKPGRGRRGKQASVEVPEETETKADTQPEAVQTSLSEVSQVQPQVKATKAGLRGRKAKQAPVQAEDVSEESATQTAEEPAQVEIAAPVEEVSKEPEPTAEAETEDRAPVVEEPTKPAVTKPTRGRRGKQAPAKVQEEVAKESELNTEAEDQTAATAVDKPAAKAVSRRRGRQAVEAQAEAQAEADQSSTTTEEPEEKPQAKLARAGRGRKTKQEAAVPAPEAEVTAEAASIAPAEVTEELPVPAVKSGRGRKTKQEVAAPESEVMSEAEPVTEPAVPAEITKEQQQPAPAVKSGRGRKAKTPAAQVQTEAVEALEATTAPEEPAKRGRGGRAVRKGKAVESEPSASQADGAETTEDVMGKATKKSVNWSADLVMTKEIESAEPEVVEGPQKKKSKCSPAAPDAAEEEPAAELKQAPKGRTAQRGRGAKKTPEPAPATAEEEEAKPEDPEPVAKPMGRRGRVAATKGPKTQPDKEEPAPAPAPKRGGKRKEVVEVETEEPAASAASPPKRKRGKAATPEEPQTEAEVPVAEPAKGRRGAAKKAEEVAEAAPERSEPPAKAAPKTVRGKRKAPQEPESTQDEMSVSAEDAPKAAPEPSSSRGRGRTQKKAAEPVTAPAETAAPARRTRRK